MPSLSLALSISPTSGSDTTQVNATLVFTYSGGSPGGSYQIFIDGRGGSNNLMPASAGTVGFSFTFGAGATGSHSIYVVYSGDGTYPQTYSNTVTYQVQDGFSTGGGSAPRRQAILRPAYSEVAATQTRAQIENGDPPAVTCQVSSIAILDGGSGYDSYTVATLTQNDTRQTLTLTLDSNGSITAVSGYDTSTQWAGPPRCTVTRWDSAGNHIAG